MAVKGLLGFAHMDTLYSLLIMFVACSAGMALMAVVMLVMGFGGMPGALLHLKGVSSRNGFLVMSGYALCALGQSYVVGAYAVFAVSLLRWFTEGHPDLPTWPLWFAAFYHGNAVPVLALKENPEEPTAQHHTLGIVGLISILVFLLIVFSPNTLKPVYGWVPYYQHNNPSTDDLVEAARHDNMAYKFRGENEPGKAREHWEKAYLIYKRKLGVVHSKTRSVQSRLDELDELANAVELPAEEKKAAMGFFGGLGGLTLGFRNLRDNASPPSNQEGVLKAVKEIGEALEQLKAADKDVLNKMYPDWGDYAQSFVTITERILLSFSEKEPYVPSEKDRQMEEWWQDNYKAIVKLLRSDPDFKNILGPVEDK